MFYFWLKQKLKVNGITLILKPQYFPALLYSIQGFVNVRVVNIEATDKAVLVKIKHCNKQRYFR